VPPTIKAQHRSLAAGFAAAVVLAGAFGLGTVVTGSAGTAPALASSATTPGKVTVSGTGTVNGIPNQLVLDMGVQVNGSSVGSALLAANLAARRVTAALKAAGVRPADIQTSGLSIQPNYQDGSQAPASYQVSEQLTATLRNVRRAGRQIQSAVTAGGNAVAVNDISLNLTDTSALLARARVAAVRDGQAKAAQFAGALHRSLGGVVSISDQTSYVPSFGAAASGFGTPRAARVPISPGTQQVSVSVTVVFALRG
jgi:uncharacterized protein YggE